MLYGQALTVLAAVYLAQDNADQAAFQARQALAVHRETGYRLGAARTLVVLGLALRRGSRHRQAALRHWQQALALFTDIGSPDAEEVRNLLRVHSQR
jgi:tetratricopeptide (TPR) repeat protein